MYIFFVQCEPALHPEHGPLLPVDVHLRGVLQLPLLRAVFVLHDLRSTVCGGVHAVRCGWDDTRRKVTTDG